MRLDLTCLALCAALALAACSSSPADTDPATNGGGDEADAAAQAEAPREAPELSGFFEPGNFGTLTVANDAGEDQPLSIDRLDVKVDVVGRFVRTEVTQVFHNHTASQTEGTYSFKLPAGASISRLAMTVDGQLMEGEIVERDKARQIYEQIVRKKKDPALLEWQGGERFQTQIFPIPANGDKKVVLAYEQILPRRGNQLRYRYDLPNLEGQPGGSLIKAFGFQLEALGTGTPTASGYDLKIDGGEVDRASLSSASFTPTGPLELTFTDEEVAPATIRYASRGGERFFLLDVVPEMPAQNSGGLQDLVVAVDTSAGIGDEELGRALASAAALTDALPSGASYHVVTGDLGQRRCNEAPMVGGDGAGKKCLKGIDAGGATDLAGLIDAAAGLAGELTERPTAVVLFTDGVASVGELDGDLIKSRASDKLRKANASLHTVAVGHAPDEGFLAELAAANRGHSVRMTPEDTPASVVETLTHLVNAPLLTNVRVSATGGKVEGLVPHHPVNLARGEALAVMGRLDEGEATITVEGEVRGQPVAQSFKVAPKAKAGNDILVNFWARAVIDDMQRGHVNRDKIVQTSTHYGVMSRYTSFLVLENDEAYKRFEIERRKEKERQQKAQQQEQASTNLKKGRDNLQDLLEDQDKATGDGEAPPTDAANEELAVEGGEAEADDDEAEPAPAPEPEFKEMAKEIAEIEEEKPMEKQERRIARPNARPAKKDKKKVRRDRRDRFGRLGGKGGGDGDILSGLSGKKNSKKVGGGSYYDRMIKGYEGRIDSLSTEEQARLVEMYVNNGQRGKARAFLQKTLRAVPEGERPAATYALFEPRPAIRQAFPRDYETAALAMLKQDPTPANVVVDYWGFLAEARRFKDIERRFSDVKVDPVTASRLLMELVRLHKQPELAERIVAAWRQSEVYTAGELYQVLTNDPDLEARLPRHVFELSRKLVASGDSRPGVMDDYIQRAGDHDALEEAATAVLGRCKEPKASDAEHCYGWYVAVAKDPRVSSILARLNKEKIATIGKTRRQDMGNAALIKEQADLYRQMGREAEARRILSEIVEFAPHDFGARNAYAAELVTLDKPVEACAEYAAAVQLNPAKRDTFKTMMGLRRTFEGHEDAIRTCIVDGVSKLPVQRDVSLVLTWDDPSNDVDLHIHEVGGEEVFFSHRESKHNGLLYYDITNGYGPEIYVLGSGPSGEYRLTLVYYRGGAKNVTGTLTVLRNAGSPEETREDRPFTLPAANSSKQIPIGTFRL